MDFSQQFGMKRQRFKSLNIAILPRIAVIGEDLQFYGNLRLQLFIAANHLAVVH